MAEIISGTIVGNSRHMTVNSDVIATDTLVSGTNYWSYTSQTVMEGGSAVRTEVQAGYLRVSNGGHAESSYINGPSAVMVVSKMAETDKTTVTNGGTLYVLAGGSATNVNIDSNATMITDVNSNTYITGTSNGKVIKVGDEVTSNITIYNSRWMDVDSGWTSYDTLVSGNGNNYWTNTSQTVLEGGSAVRTEVKAGYLLVSNGGYTDGARINGSSAVMIASRWSENENTSISNGGTLYVLAGGSATDINVDSTGKMITDVNSNTYITGTSNGKVIKVGDEVTSNITIYNSRWMDVASGWTSYDTLVSGNGNNYWTNTSQTVLEGGSAVRTEVKAGYLNVTSGGYTDSAMINGSKAIMNISAYGSANNTTVKNGGTLYMNHQGSATNVNIDKTGQMILNVSSETYLTGTSNGKAVKVADGVISNVTIFNSRWMDVASGWTSYDTLVSGNGNNYWTNTSQTVLEGGSAVRTEVKAGYLNVTSGGYTDSAMINGSKAIMDIYAYGSANNTTVKNGGTLYMNHRGSATNVKIDKTGQMILNVSSETYLTGTSNGKAVKVADGVISNVTIFNSRWMDVASGWTSYDTLVSGNGNNYWTNTSQTVLNGGRAVETEIKAGRMFVSSGAAAEGTVVNGGNAEMYVRNGGTAENTTLKNAGYLYLANGAEHQGTLTLAAGTKVEVAAGGIIDFTLTDRTSADDYLINNFSVITGAPTYTLTVDAFQESGTYKLAKSAGSFAGSITIGNGSVEFGTLTVNGEDLSYNGTTYSLDMASGNLTLTIEGGSSAPVLSSVKNDLDGNGLADVILCHTLQGFSGAWLSTGDASIIRWSSLAEVGENISLLGTGKVYGTTDDHQDIFFTDGATVGAWTVKDGVVTGYNYVQAVSDTTKVLGLGDFNGDGATDILLRSTSGDLGCFLTDGTGWNYMKGLGLEWDVAAIGDLNGDGLDDTVLVHEAGYAGTFLTQKDGTVSWADLDTVQSNMEILGTGDFNADGVDDVLLKNTDNNWIGAWIIKDGSANDFIGICTNENDIEQIADFNGDGIDDLRIRTEGGDIGMLYVNGDGSTSWQYLQGVGAEWDTKFAALA